MAGLCVVAGALVLSGAAGIGVAPAADSALSCTDIWTGGTGTTDWATAGNWSTGLVPGGTGVDACIPGGTTVVDQSAAIAVGELTIAKGSSLTISADAATGSGGANLSVSSGLDNEGTLTAGPSGTGPATLALDGPVTNAGSFEVLGTVTVGATAPSSVTNTGTLGIAPGGVVDLQKASTLTNQSNGLLAFGIDGPPSSASDYGRILQGSLSLDGGAAPVFEDGFTPSSGAEYVVATGSFSGTFANVRNNATADYSHPDALGLVGGLPATVTAIGVTSTNPTPVFGQDVRFTATVTAASESAPTGSVSFTAGGAPIGSSPVVTAAGVTTATIDTAALPVGSQPVVASYGGDVLFGPSTSAPAVLSVQPDTSNVTVAAPAEAVPGEEVTYTVSVSADTPGAGHPGGTVSLTDDGTLVSGCQSLTLPSIDPRQVTCSETYGADATHSLVATYNGSADFLPSTAAFSETVAPRPTTTTVTASPRASTTGQPVSFTATVAAGAGSASPTGSVTFTDDGTTIGTSTLTATSGGVSTTSLLLTTLPLGVNSIDASFGGDAGFGASASDAALVTVSRATTALELVSSDALTTAGQSVTFIANVFPSTGSGETGTVTFFYGGTEIGSVSVSNGQATLTTATLPIGTASVTAAYGGDANFAGSVTTAPWSQEVDPTPG